MSDSDFVNDVEKAPITGACQDYIHIVVRSDGMDSGTIYDIAEALHKHCWIDKIEEITVICKPQNGEPEIVIPQNYMDWNSDELRRKE